MPIPNGNIIQGLEETDLNKKYVKKGLTPNFLKEPKLEPFWKEFLEYRTSPEYLEQSTKGSANAAKHVHPHHLGTGGYFKRISEWDKMEADLL